MNSYEFHIGDYYRRAKNLSQTEHYIYRSLIDEYYLAETPFPPDDDRSIMRLIGLTTDQQEDLSYILKRFFTLQDDGWHHSHIEDQLNKIYAKSEKARASAAVRWDKHNANGMRTQCERNANGMLPSNPLTPLPSNPIKDARGKTSAKSTPVPYSKIIDLYHNTLPMCPRVKVLTDPRKKTISARWKNGCDGLKFWEDYFTHVKKSRFLTGRAEPRDASRKPFVADIDFLIRESTIVKTQEGKYHG